MCLTPKMDTISQEQDFPDVGHAELLKTAHALGKAERLMDAAQVLCEIEGLIKSTLEKATGEGTTSMQQECLSKFEEIPWVQRIRRQAAQHRELALLLEAPVDWTTEYAKSGITVRHRAEPGGLQRIRLDFEMDTSLLNAAAVMNEADLWHTWVPLYRFPIRGGIRNCVKLAQLTRASQLLHLQVIAPYPFTGRDWVGQWHACDQLEHQKMITVVVDDALQSDFPDHPLPAANDHVRVSVKGGIRVLVNSSSHCTLRVQWDIDPVVPVLPDVIVSFVTQTYAHLGAVQFRDMVKNLSAEHQERMRSDPHVYGFFEERMRQAGALSGLPVQPDAADADQKEGQAPSGTPDDHPEEADDEGYVSAHSDDLVEHVAVPEERAAVPEADAPPSEPPAGRPDEARAAAEGPGG
eukprot:CAMPEP_0174306918 /NCGR_PEP_ID=MMETSP0810-20121108/776_1 /TAXON_ID=73025 ORGANISM="Eutreptiella gymnastica-like, Strain CCMP1594" /NCGR_SAMPLE_ID=MMETSP0810 /ASSEMBLY_ACC=CAM_ASM_000659 /LENGTH=407 /DNA_ID=CAMNT_0015413803 /DNA_START=32 /DNA_END=1251 /DNA_ORIENTATION=-